MSKNNLAKCYIFRVSCRMPVGGKQKGEFLSTLQENVERYILENPSAACAQLEKEFGSPDDIAADFIAQMPYQEINAKFRARNRIVAVAMILAVMVLLLWGSAIAIVLHDALFEFPGRGAVEEFGSVHGGIIDETDDYLASRNCVTFERN